MFLLIGSALWRIKMPYINKTLRELYGASLSHLPVDFDKATAGELNYFITQVVQRFLGENPNYQAFNDAIGALEGAKLELYRRRVSPYEDEKILSNGDVYDK